MDIHFYSYTGDRLFILVSQQLTPRAGDYIMHSHQKYEVAQVVWDYDDKRINISLRAPL